MYIHGNDLNVRQFEFVKNVQPWEIISSTFLCMDEMMTEKIRISDFIPDISC